MLKICHARPINSSRMIQNLQNLLRSLEERRRALRMPLLIVARRSSVSLRTVYRALRDFDGSVSAASVYAIAGALVAEIALRTRGSADEVLKEQVRKKAWKIARMTQATAAMEGQAVSLMEQRRLANELARRLQAVGSPAQIWE